MSWVLNYQMKTFLTTYNMKMTLQQAIERAKLDPNSDFAKALRKKIESGGLDVAAQKQGINLGRPKAERTSFLEKLAQPGERIIKGIQEKGEQIVDTLQDDTKSPLVRGVEATAIGFTALSGTMYNALPNSARNLLDKAGVKIGEGFEKVTDKISELPSYKRYAKFANENPDDPWVKNFEGTLKVLSDAGIIAGEILLVSQGTQSLNKLNDIMQRKFAGITKPGFVEEVTRHTKSAEQAVKENPSLVKNKKEFSKLLEQTKENTQLQFRKEGLTEVADKIKAVNTTKIESIQQLSDKMILVVESPTVVELAKGAIKWVQRPVTELITEVKGVIKMNTPQGILRKAKLQGYSDQEVRFIQTMAKPDKTKALKMEELAEKVVGIEGKRITQRPIDLVGETFIEKIKPIEKLNREAGKEVDRVAKSLKGKTVDASPLSETAFNLIDELESFKYTPELSKKLEKFIEDIPSGTVDAYELHIFKKAIDELVNFGVAGEGLKGKAQSLLKQLRTSADDILDTNFKDYNKANTDFRNTITVLNDAKDLFGKKNGFTNERGGQLMRSAFSNNAQRGRLLPLMEDIEKLSKQYGLSIEQNLIDQALFALMLEDIYGTQAITSFRGQIEKAVSGVQRVTEGLRNPTKGAGDLLATGTEKVLGISDKGKKALLKELLMME